MKNKSLFVSILVIVLVLICVMLGYREIKRIHVKKNKEIATLFVYNVLEGKDMVSLVTKYCDPDIQVVLPQKFKMPRLGTNVIKGENNFLTGLKAWDKDTDNVDRIVDVVGEGDNVCVVVNTNRIFNMGRKKEEFDNNPMMFSLKFKNGKIKKITGVFDVLDDEEQYKAKEYHFKQK